MRRTGEVRIIDQRTAQERSRSFLPGMTATWLLPLYDVVSRVAGARALHERVVESAAVQPGQTVVDVGCGTGNLSFALLAAQPEAVVSGLDPDGAALRRAARKARRRGVSLTLLQGYADRLPAEDASVDHVVSAMAVHHLDEPARAAFAREALRALRPGGRVTVVDFAGPDADGAAHSSPDHGDGHTRGHASTGHAHGHGGPGHAVRHLIGLVRRRGNQKPDPAHSLGEGVAALLTGAGFGNAREIAHVDHRFGRVAFVQATRL